MSDLSFDEITLLLIAAQDQSMMPIGCWEVPLKSLVDRGYLKSLDPFNHVITAAGRAAAKQAEDDSLRAMINVNNTIVQGQKETESQAEQIAVQLVDLAETSNRITGDDKIEALHRWARVILERALEIMK